MGLDFSLIKTSTQNALDNLNKLQKTECPAVFLISNIISDSLLKKLIDYIHDTTLWEIDIKNGVHYKNRLKLNWEAETVIEELHIVFESLTDVLNKRFNRNNQFLGITVWKDLENYTIAPHCDNRIIDISMQIYLTEGVPGLGTVFKYNDTLITANYQKNHGYIMDNRQYITHYLANSVPPGHVRYSVYAIWTDSNK